MCMKNKLDYEGNDMRAMICIMYRCKGTGRVTVVEVLSQFTDEVLTIEAHLPCATGRHQVFQYTPASKPHPNSRRSSSLTFKMQ